MSVAYTITIKDGVVSGRGTGSHAANAYQGLTEDECRELVNILVDAAIEYYRTKFFTKAGKPRKRRRL